MYHQHEQIELQGVLRHTQHTTDTDTDTHTHTHVTQHNTDTDRRTDTHTHTCVCVCVCVRCSFLFQLQSGECAIRKGSIGASCLDFIFISIFLIYFGFHFFIFQSGECIIRKGSIGASLFLIESGSAVAVSNGTVIEELPEVSVNAKPYLYPT